MFPLKLICSNCKCVVIKDNYFTCPNKCSNFCVNCQFICIHSCSGNHKQKICPNCTSKYKYCSNHGVNYCISCDKYHGMC